MSISDNSGIGSELVQVQPRIDNYTGERLERSHPEKNALVIQLLADGRSYRDIERQTGCNRRTIHAVQYRKAEAIAAQKLELRNIAILGAQLFMERAIDCAENIQNPLQLATTAGIFTDKALLLSSESSAPVQLPTTPTDIYRDFQQINIQIINNLNPSTVPAATQPKPIEALEV